MGGVKINVGGGKRNVGGDKVNGVGDNVNIPTLRSCNLAHCYVI